MHQRRHLQRLARPLLRQLRGRQLPQPLINQRQKLFGCLRIAGIDFRQNARDAGHGNEDSQPAAEMPENEYGRPWGAPKSVVERVTKNVGFARHPAPRIDRAAIATISSEEVVWLFKAP